MDPVTALADHQFTPNCYAGVPGFSLDSCAWCSVPEDRHPADGPVLAADRGDVARTEKVGP